MRRLQPKDIPNVLTVIRILFVPVVVVLCLINTGVSIYKIDVGSSFLNISIGTFLAGILFILLSITDAIDGHLARKNNWGSDFGKLWDPIADKILVNSVLICFASANMDLIPSWIVVIFIARDVIVEGMRIQASVKNIIVPANIWGKLKTVFQMVAIIVLFFFGNSYCCIPTWYFYGVQNALLYIACITSVVSGIIYIININKELKNV